MAGKLINLHRVISLLIGGIINKNETIDNTMAIVTLNEINNELKSVPKFIGVFEHFYDDSNYENVSTHYLEIANEYEEEETLGLPTKQQSEYQWFTVDELLNSNQLHKYIKDYFRN